MKTFGQIISEVAQPKAGDEKHFKEKHITVKKDHPTAPDSAFTGGTKKAPKRIADYDKGEDELVYEGSFDVPDAVGGEYDKEESHKKYKDSNKSSKMKKEAALDPVNKKAALGKFKDRADKDIDNDGDVDSSDEYLHNRRKAVTKAVQKEETENLEEISRDLARSYIRKAMAHKTTGETPKKDRSSGVNLAGKKAYDIGGKARVPATESVELEEKLKASDDMGKWIDDFQKSDNPKFVGKSQKKRREMAIAAKYAAEREAGMREEVEQIDEISKKTLGSYIKKAASDVANKAAEHDVTMATHSGPEARKHRMGLRKNIRKREAGMSKALDRLTKEEVEQLDELSPNTLHSYIKKAAGNMAGNAAVAAAQASSSMKKSSPDVKRKIKNRMQGISGASGRLADKANMAENAWEEVPMMMRQLQFICYAAEEIMDYLDMSVDPEEWFQNKLAHVHDQMQTLHAYAEGDMRQMSKMGYGMYGEEAELDEVSTKMLRNYLSKANSDMDSINNKAEDEPDSTKRRSLYKRLGKRRIGTSLARGKLTGEPYKKNPGVDNTMLKAKIQSEEVELDEATPTKKAITRALQGMKVQPKDKVSLKKAPWEKNEDLSESIEQIKKHHVSNIAHFDKYPNGDTAMNIHHQRMAKLHSDAASKAKSAGNKKMADAHSSAANAHRSANGTVAAFNRAVEKTKQTFNESVELDEVSKGLASRYLNKARAQRGSGKDREKSISLAYRKSTPGKRANSGYDSEPKVYAKEDLDESITKMSDARLKFHATKKIPHGSFSNSEIEDEHDRRKKTDPNYHKVKPSLSEVTRSAIKRPVSYVDSQGKSRTRLVPIRKVDRDEHGQEKIKESFLEEAFKEGLLKLKDGSSVTIKKEDAKVLNQLMNSLNDKNRQKMELNLMSGKKGFNEILSFAREAL